MAGNIKRSRSGLIDGTQSRIMVGKAKISCKRRNDGESDMAAFGEVTSSLPLTRTLRAFGS